MKKLFLVLAMVASACAWAESEVVDGVTWYYETYTSSKVTYARITSGADKYTGDLVIPNTLGGYKVKEIGGSAFSGCSSLTSVTLPNGVTSIGTRAFSGCSSLTSVTIPEGVESIGQYAFSGCGSLVSVTMPEGVTNIGRYAFSGCSSLKSVAVPVGVTSINSDVFYGCSSLTEVTIPNSVTSIGSGAFSGCSSLTSVTIPEGVTSIGISAFFGCRSLERFDVPASVTSIGGAFVIRGCDSLTVITVAEGNANYKCVNNCIVSANGTTLVAVPFGCEEVDIPEGVTEIPASMFDRDENLVRVVLPNGLVSIGNGAFSYCHNLQLVDVPAGCLMIGDEAFRGCSRLADLTLRDGLTSIGNSALVGCNISELTLPESVTAIGSYALSGESSSLRKVVFLGTPPSGVANCGFSSLTTVSYPREYGAAWLAVMKDINRFKGYNRKQPEVAVVSSRIRASDPTILDVVYKVTSSQPTVKVRALAFEDGVRSFANVVRPETFVADTNGVATAGNVGDAIEPNVEHTLSWRVASDWSNRLAKVAFEVLASEGDLLPLEVRTIPASEQFGKMDVTWNVITQAQWYDALMWLYADKNEKVTITDGVYFYDGKVVAKGKTMYYDKTESNYYSRTRDPVTSQYIYVRYKNVQEVVLGEMGYMWLTGDALNYANDETRLGLSPSGYRQYGYRIVGE